ncbi:flagellar hook-associated protein FlgK [Trichlorobacter ammonificans]|uniref:Flagellar hook-associated protein 1 n=1 Tax=Trichlorobacter ammonificans TaxID=2916410 RepID=A0ABN8HGM2_9BACT|nr:flagellar hook-associated protein FlgK [Trichlorobacter ammonificans]CAH2030015.1 Flagellar hook-associated protein flgK [Trichlorobacter ammonificans]
MGLSAAFEIGSAGLRIHQVAMEVMSENIANVNTPGYSRQRVILETAPPTTHNGFPLASGVKIATVERYYDALLQKQLVNAGTTSGYNTTTLQVLQQVEPAFNELAKDGLGAAITDFFNAWQDLTLNPIGTAERQTVLSKAEMLTDQFRYASRTLTDAMVTQDESLTSLTSDINAKLKDIAYLNGQIKTTELIHGNANEMRDQRDYLIRQLGESVAVSFVENTDGTTDVSYTDGTGTYSLVSGSTVVNNFTLVANGTLPDPLSTTKHDVQLTPTGGGAAVTIAPTTGKLGATLVMRDTTLQGYLTDLDTLANSIVSDVNGLHVSTGGRPTYDLNGAAGGLFFDSAGTTAATISLDSNVLGAPANIAAALSNFSGDSSNALAIAQLNSKVNNYSSSYKTLVAQIGLDVQAAKSVTSQDAAFMKQLQTLRDSNSGVSLDEELAALIKYQRSYQASARLITTATEMMDTVIAMMR